MNYQPTSTAALTLFQGLKSPNATRQYTGYFYVSVFNMASSQSCTVKAFLGSTQMLIRSFTIADVVGIGPATYKEPLICMATSISTPDHVLSNICQASQSTSAAAFRSGIHVFP